MTIRFRARPLPVGRPCPKCGAALTWNRARTVELCRAPDRADPLRQCGYLVVHHQRLFDVLNQMEDAQ